MPHSCDNRLIAWFWIAQSVCEWAFSLLQTGFLGFTGSNLSNSRGNQRVSFRCVYVCMYVSVYICAYVCMYACTYVCKNNQISSCLCVYMVCMYAEFSQSISYNMFLSAAHALCQELYICRMMKWLMNEIYNIYVSVSIYISYDALLKRPTYDEHLDCTFSS